MTELKSSASSSNAKSGTKTVSLASTPLGDTIAASTATTATVAIGGTASGVINTAGDHDWFAVQLVQGQYYVLTLDATSGVDPYLRLRDASGAVLRENDDVDFPTNTNSRIAFTATSTGTYYLDAADFDIGTGSYTLSVSVAPAPPIYTIDQIATHLTTGYWGGPTAHWVPGDSISYNVQGLLPAAQALARTAFAMWQDVVNLTFVETTTAADIMLDDTSIGAFANSNSTNGVTTSASVNVQQNWSGEGTPGQDSYTFQTFIHEIGHTLGLGHGGFYDGNATYGVDNHYQNDTWATTVMSYFGQSNYNGASERFVMSPMMADIVALQGIYGANTTTRAGATVYGHNATAGPIFSFATYTTAPSFTIWDGGGVDTLDASGYSATQTLSLLSESTSSLGGLQQNIHIARNVVIENAIGGSGDDTIIGNAVANTLAGNGGNDTVSYAGSTVGVRVNLAAQSVSGGHAAGDTISGFENAAGGAGVDILIGSVGNNTFTGNAGNDFAYGGDGLDTLNGDADNDVLFGDGGNDTVNGGAGIDYAYGGAGTNTLSGGAGIDILVIDGINDTAFGGTNAAGAGGAGDVNYFYVNAGAMNATIWGDGAQDIYIDLSGAANATFTFRGGDGGDYVYGGGGADSVFGDAGNDVLSGGAGNDTLNAGVGIDYSTGGAGNDTFVVNKTDGIVLITDFVGGGTDDTVRLVGTSFTSFAHVQAALTPVSSGMILTVDADTQIWFLGLNPTSLTASDFTFV